MPKQFKGKYLVRFNRIKPYDKIDIWNLEVLDIANPISPAYRDDVIYAYKDYENIRDQLKKEDGELVYDEYNKIVWLLTNANSLDEVCYKILKIFSA